MKELAAALTREEVEQNLAELRRNDAKLILQVKEDDSLEKNKSRFVLNSDPRDIQQ